MSLNSGARAAQPPSLRLRPSERREESTIIPMKTCPRPFLALLAGLLFTSLAAEEPDISAIPDSLAAGIREEFAQDRAKLAERWRRFEAKREAFHGEFGRTIAKDSPHAAEAARRRQALLDEGKEITVAVDAFEDRLVAALTVWIDSLTRQIEETKRQLQGQGFAGRAEEFDRIHDTSRDAINRMKSQLITRLQEALLNKTKSLAEDKILERVGKLTPAQVDRFEAFTRKAETPCPDIVRVLRVITAGDNPARLTADAKSLLEGIGKAKELFEFSEKAAQEAIEARQEAALIVLSFVLEHPMLDELKTVGHAGYNVGEAWFYYFTLSREADSLLRTTDQQLRDQKVVIKRMEDLVQARRTARADLKRLQDRT